MKRISWTGWVVIAAAAVGPNAVRGQEGAPEPGAVFERLDKNADGKVSADEIPEDQRRFFERLVRQGDRNDDGVLSRDEFVQASQPEERPAPDAGRERNELRERLEALDRNRDGKVSREEIPEPLRERFREALERAGKDEFTLEEFGRVVGAGRPEPGEMFRRLDQNGDGQLTRDEIPAELRERLAPLMERLGKETLTRDDIARMLERRGVGPEGAGPMRNPEEAFARIDRNEDGKVTLDEAPEPVRPMIQALLRRTGKGEDGSFTREEFVRAVREFRPEGERPRGEGERPRGEGDRPRGEGDRPRGEGERPRGEGERPRGEGERPRGEGERPRGEGDRPRGEGERPRGEGERPRGEGDRPRGEGDRPRGEGDRPRGEGERPRGEGERPRGEGERPRGEGEMRRDAEGPRPPFGGPAFLRLLDTDRDGRLSREELRRLEEVFEELDRNRDGRLDMPELMGGPFREGRGEPPRPRPEDSPREPRPEEPRGEPRPQGDRGPRGQGPAPFFSRMDRNEDGKLSRDEAPEFLRDRFDRIDSDKDGFLSVDEFQAAARARAGDRPDGPRERPREDSPRPDSE